MPAGSATYFAIIRALLFAGVYLGIAMLLGIFLAWGLFELTGYTYTKLLSRSVLLMAALGLVPVWYYLALSRAEIGLGTPRQDGIGGWLACLFRPFAMALAFILPVMLFFAVVGFRVRDESLVLFDLPFFGLLCWLFLSAWLVACFEEILFRGVLFTALRRYVSFKLTAGVTGALYAMAHFLVPANVVVDEVGWQTGFARIGESFAGLQELPQQWDAFACLFLLGFLFAWVRERVDLWSCIALHAAWVFAIRLYKELTVRDIVNAFQPWVGEYDNFTGNLVSLWLLFGFVLLALYRRWQANLHSPLR